MRDERGRRRRLARRVPIAGAVALVLAQLVPVTRDNPAVGSDVDAPPAVAAVLRRACYDCHSHETVWPWYSRVAPVSWLVAHDVDHGREELNFSTWSAYDDAKRRKKLKETVEEVAEGEMPPWYYVLVHPEARLADADVELLRAWAAASGARAPHPIGVARRAGP
jgi:hypothetical protein